VGDEGQERGGERAAEEVPRDAGGDGEVEHLRGEDERRGEARERHEPLVEVPAGHDDAGADGDGGEEGEREGGRSVDDVHWDVQRQV
ncbi:hypothetical protein ADL26_19445, partial [Thermoactinomyces vulgaris]